MAVKSKNKGLVAHLKRWGLEVEVVDGWRQRGRPFNFYPRAIIAHHTASGDRSGNFGSERIVTSGRSDLPGPLCQFLLGRDGKVKIVAAGYANHAGYGGPYLDVPKNMGNTYTYGIEAENNGIGEKWSAKQLNAYYRLCAALLVWMGRKQVDRVFGHKEWTSRKIDPAGIDMNVFRQNVQKALNHGPSVKTVSLSKLKPGKRNADVVKLKKVLRKKGFFEGTNGKFYGKHLEKAVADYRKSLGFKAKADDGTPGKTALNKLGFRVVK